MAPQVFEVRDDSTVLLDDDDVCVASMDAKAHIFTCVKNEVYGMQLMFL